MGYVYVMRDMGAGSLDKFRLNMVSIPVLPKTV